MTDSSGGLVEKVAQAIRQALAEKYTQPRQRAATASKAIRELPDDATEEQWDEAYWRDVPMAERVEQSMWVTFTAGDGHASIAAPSIAEVSAVVAAAAVQVVQDQTVKIKIDRVARAAYVPLTAAVIERTVCVGDIVNVDLAADGQPVGIEILDWPDHLGPQIRLGVGDE